ncbi:MAG: FG-GAP repeat protein [Planctomycetota bacterium]
MGLQFNAIPVVFVISGFVVTPLVTKPKSTQAFTPLYTVDGNLAYDRLGYSIITLDDLDGDGKKDILVGAPNRNPIYPQPGHAYVVSAANGNILRTHTGINYADRYGRALGHLGDLNNDGIPEYTVGATWGELPDPQALDVPGTVTIFDGRTGNVIETLAGNAEGECFGGGFARLNDVDGDGTQDFVVASRFGNLLNGDPATAHGEIRILSGKTLTYLSTTTGTLAGDYLGGEPMGTAAVGDQNGDGIIDIAAGAWAASGNAKRGDVAIISGADGAVLHWLHGDKAGDQFGWAVGSLPDMDGNGRPEIVVGAPYAGLRHTGEVSVISAQTGNKLYTFKGTVRNAGFGFSFATMPGDNNGLGDLIVVGSPYHNKAAGRVQLISVRTGGVVATVSGDSQGDQFGHAVAAVDDITDTGIASVAVGAIGAPGGSEQGRMTVYKIE